jgi:hypothetical protein
MTTSRRTTPNQAGEKMPMTLPKTNYETSNRMTVVLDFTDTGYVYLEDAEAAIEPLVSEIRKRLAPLGVQPQDIQIEFSS